MKESHAWLAVVVAGAVLAAAPAASQQVAVPAQTATAQKPAEPQTEADKKLAAIMKGASGSGLNAARLVDELQQFITDNPDFPRLENVYSNLVMFAGRDTANAERALAIADQVLAKYPAPNSTARRSALTSKLMTLQRLKRDDEIKALCARLLDTETNVSVLQAAARYDRANGVKLLEKAIAERRKNESATAAPTLDDLRWSYADALEAAGRKEEAKKLSEELMAESTKAIAELEALPRTDPKRSRLSMLRMTLTQRYTTMSTQATSAGQLDKALEYIDLAEQASGPGGLRSPDRFWTTRAGIYAKAGKVDLELDAYVQAFAYGLDVKTRDKIIEVSGKLGKDPEAAYARARELRAGNAKPVFVFDLKTLEGEAITLDGLRKDAKVTLVNFFFPT
jgi:tetratricopeptide (TPR) repeat protein